MHIYNYSYEYKKFVSVISSNRSSQKTNSIIFIKILNHFAFDYLSKYCRDNDILITKADPSDVSYVVDFGRTHAYRSYPKHLRMIYMSYEYNISFSEFLDLHGGFRIIE